MEERMKILKMLEEGKITAEEAVKLLEAIKDIEPGYKIVIKEAGEAVSSAVSSVADMLKNVSHTIAEKIKQKAEKVAEKTKTQQKK